MSLHESAESHPDFSFISLNAGEVYEIHKVITVTISLHRISALQLSYMKHSQQKRMLPSANPLNSEAIRRSDSQAFDNFSLFV